MIGGNPCMNKYFPELCAIFVEEIPNQKQRGLWSNNIFDYQQVVAETFGMFNLNPHNDKRGIKSFERLKQIIPQITYFKGHSHHAPLLTAMQDLYPDPEEMWRLIQGCDINRQWSASIVQNRGELRAYFCEVAASFDLARGEDHGIPVAEGWWLRTMPEFSDQVKHFCPGCGVPARLKDHLDIGDRRHLHQPRDRERAERELSQKLPRGHALPESWRLHRFEAVDKESAQAEPTPSTVPPALKGNYLSHLACARLA